MLRSPCCGPLLGKGSKRPSGSIERSCVSQLPELRGSGGPLADGDLPLGPGTWRARRRSGPGRVDVAEAAAGRQSYARQEQRGEAYA